MMNKILCGLAIVFLFWGNVNANECIPNDVRMLSVVYKGERLYMIQRCDLVSYVPSVNNPTAKYDWRNIINPCSDYTGVRKRYKQMKKQFDLDREREQLESLKWKVIK